MNTNRLQGVRLPAEWEQQRAIMLIWPHEDTDWCPYLEEITEVYLQMAKAITRHEKLLIAARDTERVQDLLTKHLTEGQMKQVTIFACDNNDTWARDVAPITLLQTRQRAELNKRASFSTSVSMDGERSLLPTRIIRLTKRFTRRGFSRAHL